MNQLLHITSTAPRYDTVVRPRGLRRSTSKQPDISCPQADRAAKVPELPRHLRRRRPFDQMVALLLLVACWPLLLALATVWRPVNTWLALTVYGGAFVLAGLVSIVLVNEYPLVKSRWRRWTGNLEEAACVG